MKYGPITEAIGGKQDVVGFFERATSTLEEFDRIFGPPPSERKSPEPCPDCDLGLRICPACRKAGYRGEAHCICHEVGS
jgi:hypothetical protein